MTCGKGVQVRAVFCKQPHQKGVHAIVPNSECTEQKPDYIQTCNSDIVCPIWVKGQWSRVSQLISTQHDLYGSMVKDGSAF